VHYCLIVFVALPFCDISEAIVIFFAVGNNERTNNISTKKSHNDKIIYPRLSYILLHTPGAWQQPLSK
jgi:hypothetical protein